MSDTIENPRGRSLLAGATAALATGGAAIVTTAHSGPVASSGGADAELIRVCHRFAEEEMEHWYCYVMAAVETADDLEYEPDWDSLHWIIATPATTPEGWHAKGLAYTAWNREAYDDHPVDRDTASPLLAALFRDMVAPARNAIVARLAAKYGPLPDSYTREGIWLGEAAA